MKPKSITVHGFKIPIEYKKLEENFRGLYHYSPCRIEINNALAKDDLTRTLIHELIHAVFDKGSINQCAISHDAQELICDQIANVICKNFKLTKKKI